MPPIRERFANRVTHQVTDMKHLKRVWLCVLNHYSLPTKRVIGSPRFTLGSNIFERVGKEATMGKGDLVDLSLRRQVVVVVFQLDHRTQAAIDRVLKAGGGVDLIVLPLLEGLQHGMAVK